MQNSFYVFARKCSLSDVTEVKRQLTILWIIMLFSSWKLNIRDVISIYLKELHKNVIHGNCYMCKFRLNTHICASIPMYMVVYVSICQCTQVYGGICQYTQVYGGMCQYTQVYGGIWWYIPVYPSIWWYMPVYASIPMYMVVYASVSKYMVVCASICQYMLVYQSIWW